MVNNQLMMVNTWWIMVLGDNFRFVMEKNKNGWFIGEKSHLEMDGNWGYPYFRKPPLMISWLMMGGFFGNLSSDF